MHALQTSATLPAAPGRPFRHARQMIRVLAQDLPAPAGLALQAFPAPRAAFRIKLESKHWSATGRGSSSGHRRAKSLGVPAWLIQKPFHAHSSWLAEQKAPEQDRESQQETDGSIHLPKLELRTKKGKGERKGRQRALTSEAFGSRRGCSLAKTLPNFLTPTTGLVRLFSLLLLTWAV